MYSFANWIETSEAKTYTWSSHFCRFPIGLMIYDIVPTFFGFIEVLVQALGCLFLFAFD